MSPYVMTTIAQIHHDDLMRSAERARAARMVPRRPSALTRLIASITPLARRATPGLRASSVRARTA